MKKILTTLVLFVFALLSFAQTPREEIKENIFRSGSNYYAYPGPLQEVLTPSPVGYEPFYISHYGRHGSRYLINDSDYDKAFTTLSRADTLGKLTSYGRDVLRRVKLIREEATLRHGELTLRGAEQHPAIASRMIARFPEVFEGKTTIDAKSTVVIRCILSMENALHALLRVNPDLQIRHDASEHDMWYMNFNDRELKKKVFPLGVEKTYDEFCKDHQHNDRIMNNLFNDKNYWTNEVNAQDLAYHLFKLASNIQSTEIRHDISLYDVFTEEELYDMWLQTNAWWYIHYGPSPLNNGIAPYSQRNLLRVMISEADSCLQLPHPGATLRYGHEVCVMPLACLLELDDFGKSIIDLEDLDDNGWACYKIFPMACNIQIVFYRPVEASGDILLKVLLNENEARLPLPSAGGPYYKWKDFKAYFTQKLDAFKLK